MLEMEPPDTNPATAETDKDVIRWATLKNIAEEIDGEVLETVGKEVVEYFDIDEQSRKDWIKSNEDYIKLATQVKEEKSFPWPNASNVKYPLLTIASLQFQSRSYQALVNSQRVVRARVVGNDPDGRKRDRANRISQHMSYQLLEQMDNWEDEMDNLCLLMPLSGNVFKKTYYNGVKNVSELVLPQNLVVNYYAKSIEDASRKTEIIQLFPNQIVQQIRSGYFLEFEYQKPEVEQELPLAGVMYDMGHKEPEYDPDAPHIFLECHCWWDLDEDGYEEPYIITVHKDTQTVVRIVARFSPKSVALNSEGKIAQIIPDEYYTNFIFIPNPVSGVYGLGFGTLLGPLNEACNTIINQLVDSGTLNNLPSGFLGRGIRMTNGNMRFSPGEWKFVNVPGQDLKAGIMPLPINQPSPVLFQLLGMLTSSAMQIASVTDTMQGQMPGQNTPHSTTSEMLNQGLQVFSSILKRIHRSLRKEFKKLYRLNSLWLNEQEYFSILDENGEEIPAEIMRMDYETDSFDVMPAADPNIVSDAQKLADAEVIFSLLQLGTINAGEATRRILEARNIPQIAKLLEMPPPQPNFDQQIEMQRLELEKKQHEGGMQLDFMKQAYEQMKAKADAILSMAKAQSEQGKAEIERLKMEHEKEMGKMDMAMKGLDMQLQQLKTQTEVMKIQSMKQEARTMKYDPKEKKVSK